MIQTTKKTQRVNIKAEIKPEGGSAIDITDNIDTFSIEYGVDSLTPEISIEVSLNSGKIKQYKIGNYTESYTVTIGLPIPGSDTVIDTVIELTPLEYAGLNLLDLPQNVGSSTNSAKNVSSSKFTIKCIYKESARVGSVISYSSVDNGKIDELKKEMDEKQEKAIENLKDVAAAKTDGFGTKLGIGVGATALGAGAYKLKTNSNNKNTPSKSGPEQKIKDKK